MEYIFLQWVPWGFEQFFFFFNETLSNNWIHQLERFDKMRWHFGKTVLRFCSHLFLSYAILISVHELYVWQSRVSKVGYCPSYSLSRISDLARGTALLQNTNFADPEFSYFSFLCNFWVEQIIMLSGNIGKFIFSLHDRLDESQIIWNMCIL